MKDKLTLAHFLKAILPYVYFIGVMAYWFYDTLASNHGLNGISLLLIGILLVQLKLNNNVFGFFFGIFLILSCMGFLVATLSEYGDFQVISASAKQLLVTGSTLAGVGFVMAILMSAYHFRKLDVNLEHDFKHEHL